MKYHERNKYCYFIHVHVYAYFTQLQRGRFSCNRLTSLDALEKYEIFVQKSPN